MDVNSLAFAATTLLSGVRFHLKPDLELRPFSLNTWLICASAWVLVPDKYVSFGIKWLQDFSFQKICELRMSLEQALRYGAGDLGDLHRGFYDIQATRTQAIMVRFLHFYHLPVL